MTENDEVHNALLAIHSRLGTIEGKINLLARVERDEILRFIEDAVSRTPLLGQIYLLLDGKRSQREILEELTAYSVETSQSTVSRRMDDLVTEYGIADPVGRKASERVLRRNRAAEDVLNLKRRIRRWLQEQGETVPLKPTRRSQTS